MWGAGGEALSRVAAVSTRPRPGDGPTRVYLTGAKRDSGVDIDGGIDGLLVRVQGHP